PRKAFETLQPRSDRDEVERRLLGMEQRDFEGTGETDQPRGRLGHRDVALVERTEAPGEEEARGVIVLDRPDGIRREDGSRRQVRVVDEVWTAAWISWDRPSRSPTPLESLEVEPRPKT